MAKEIGIEVAKKIAYDYDYSKVIIYGIANDGVEHITTFGKTLSDKYIAAEKGNEIKRLNNWPDEYCNSKPEINE